MAFAFTEEQEQFRDIVARFLRDTSPPVEVPPPHGDGSRFRHGGLGAAEP